MHGSTGLAAAPGGKGGACAIALATPKAPLRPAPRCGQSLAEEATTRPVVGVASAAGRARAGRWSA